MNTSITAASFSTCSATRPAERLGIGLATSIDDRFASAATGAAASSTSLCAVFASPQNLDLVVRVAGAGIATDLSERANRELSRLGETFRLGDDFATVAVADFGAAIDRLRSISWLAHVFIGVTEAWRFRARDKWLVHAPRRLFELSAGYLFGVTPIEADSVAALNAARQSVADQRNNARGAHRHGFPALVHGKFRTLTQIADPSCPACGAPAASAEDQATIAERCARCDLEYERHLTWLVGGRDVGVCTQLVGDE